MAGERHPTALISDKASIGEDTNVWAFTNIMEGAVIGSGCNICDSCFVEGEAVVGDNVTLKNGVSVWTGVTLENNVFVGPSATFVNDRFPRSRDHEHWEIEKTLVKQGASIGANATIMCGVTIGAYAVIGAGAVVLSDVSAHGLVVGNPARQVGWVGRDGRRLNENLESASGEKYRLGEHGLELM